MPFRPSREADGVSLDRKNPDSVKKEFGYTLTEEIVNTATHAVGLVMGLAVTLFFLLKSTPADSWVVPFALGLYLVGVVGSYATSTLYHAIPASKPEAKALARKFDHAAIYWHIAGSYTPLTLIAMIDGGERVWGLVICSFVWLAALVGTGLSFRKMKAQSYLETACYVLMGLTILVAFKPFYACCGLPIVLWVVGEGVAYITGAVLYSFKKVPYMHSVFHLFVILGDICHMIATWKMLQLFVLNA